MKVELLDDVVSMKLILKEHLSRKMEIWRSKRTKTIVKVKVHVDLSERFLSEFYDRVTKLEH